MRSHCIRNQTTALIRRLLCAFHALASRSHCYDQKQEFGAAAMADFPYVECFPQGWKKVSRTAAPDILLPRRPEAGVDESAVHMLFCVEYAGQSRHTLVEQ